MARKSEAQRLADRICAQLRREYQGRSQGPSLEEVVEKTVKFVIREFRSQDEAA